MDLFGNLQTECGYTPDQIRSMTLWDVDRLFKFWSRQPPQGQLLVAIAKVLGIEIAQPTDPSRHIDSPEAAIAAIEAIKALGIGQR